MLYQQIVKQHWHSNNTQIRHLFHTSSASLRWSVIFHRHFLFCGNKDVTWFLPQLESFFFSKHWYEYCNPLVQIFLYLILKTSPISAPNNLKPCSFHTLENNDFSFEIIFSNWEILILLWTTQFSRQFLLHWNEQNIMQTSFLQ